MNNRNCFGTLMVPSEEMGLAQTLQAIQGWCVAVFTVSGDGFNVGSEIWSGYVDFEAVPFPFLNAAAIIYTEMTWMQAKGFLEKSGLPIICRKIDASFAKVDRDWLDQLAAKLHANMMIELNLCNSTAGEMRSKIDDLRTGFSLLKCYLERHDVPPLRKIWHAPYQEGGKFEVTVPFSATLPFSSWGLTRIEVWIVTASRKGDFVVELSTGDTEVNISTWRLNFGQVGCEVGWIPLDLDESMQTYGQLLKVRICGIGWVLGASAPWCAEHRSDSSIETFRGPAMRAYATLPGVSGPRRAASPVDDRRRLRLLHGELGIARALAIPPNIDFLPVNLTDKGLLVHPIENAPMIAVLDGVCPSFMVFTCITIEHGHREGQSFLVTVASDLPSLADPLEPAYRASELGVINEIGPILAGTWVLIDAGAVGRVKYSFPPQAVARSLFIVTHPAPGRKPDLAWATVTSLEFVIADG